MPNQIALNKCPACGGETKISIPDGFDCVRVYCSEFSCNMSGPWRRTEEEAARAWNAATAPRPATRQWFGGDLQGRITFDGEFYPYASHGITEEGLRRAKREADWINERVAKILAGQAGGNV